MIIAPTHQSPANLQSTQQKHALSISNHKGPMAAHSAQSRQNVEQIRNRVLQDVNEIHRHFSELRADNVSTDGIESLYDDALFPTMVNATNKRKDDLNIVYLDDGFKSLNEVDLNEVNQALIQLSEPYNHTVAADVRQFGDQKSIIMFESLPNGKIMEYDSKEFQKEIPNNTTVSIFCLDQQKSSFGCRMFSLSNASKLADLPHAMDKLHKLNITNESYAMLKSTGAKEMDKVGNVSVYDLPTNITPKIMKHTQARSTLKNLASESLERIVNSKGETLPERLNRHAVSRFVSVGAKTKQFSASIEDKRMTYLERAKDYLKTASADELLALDNEFRKLKNQYLMPSQLPVTSDSDDDI